MDNLLDDDFTGHAPPPLQPVQPQQPPNPHPMHPLHPTQPPPLEPTAIRREHDSVDDFEHLDGDSSSPKDQERKLLGDFDDFTSPSGPAAADRIQSFLDAEREEPLIPTGFSAAPLIPEEAPRFPSSVPQFLGADEGNEFSDSREELSPAPSEDSFEDSAAPNRSLPPSPAHVPAAKAPEPSAPVRIPEPTPPAPVRAPEPTPPAPVRVPEPTPPAPTRVSEPKPVPTASSAASGLPKSSAKSSAVKPAKMGEVLKGCAYAWFNPDRLHPKVESLVYWRNPAKSGAALAAGLVLLLALACCSLISVLAYCSLLILAGTIAYRIYKSVLQAIQKTSDGHPFKDILDTDLSLSPERTQELAVLATAHINASVSELRRLFLVEDLVDSLKFGTLLWCLTYLGAWFNGMTLIIIGYVALFTLPKIYETNKTQIDANIQLVTDKFQEITNKVKAAIPIGKKGESEKDK